MKTVKCADILLPKVADLSKWAVVSCDQFTSERDYWQRLDEYVGDSPSTLRLIFPEVYLEDGDAEDRIAKINRTMEGYLSGGIFTVLKDGFILVKRDTEEGNSRLGLVGAIDLEDYSYVHPTTAPLRATEGVVVDRIPPRLKVRKGAPIELPHVMILADDREKVLVETLWDEKKEEDKLYDFDLNMNGGHLTGYRVDSAKVFDKLAIYEQNMKKRYGEDSTFRFAVGDGNHSLATAQAHWNEVKKSLSDEEKENHPARFALCEIENLHDDGIKFEPIHRALFGADNADFLTYLSGELKGDGKLTLEFGGIAYAVACNSSGAECIAEVQSAIDKYIDAHACVSVDYVHGENHLRAVAEQNDGVAIFMPYIQKDGLFRYVLDHGNLCRKAFSMGEAEEKRYYFECRKIK